MIIVKTSVTLFLLILLITSNVFPQSDSVKVEFSFNSDTSKSVSIAGSFNNWNPNQYYFKNENGIWNKSIKLKPGYYYYKLIVDRNWISDPSNPQKIFDGGDGFNSIIKAGNPPKPKRIKSKIPFLKDELPQPILESNPELIDLYYAAWQMAWNKIKSGSKVSGFVDRFMDEGFNEMIYQWDTSFMMFFGMYGSNVFPVIQSLDNFYNKQEPDGYIQRVYNEITGEKATEQTKDKPMVNPPLFSWIELEYYKFSGDSSRLRKVLPVLSKYFYWIKNNCRDSVGKGLYYTSPLGSGMDNTPRFNIERAGWIDFSAQQALNAKYISEIASIIKLEDVSEKFIKEYNAIKQLVNKLCWSDNKKYYFDLTENDTLCNTYHIGAFWTLISDIADPNKTNELINVLTDTLHFWRSNLVPTLSYSDKYYDPKGYYWRGSVWAPTNYMLIKGLEEKGFNNIADSIVYNHLKQVCNVYNNFHPDENKIAFEERYDDGYKTIWECYSPEYEKPATRWDKTFYSRQDFVGWSGLGPIALLIENVLGFEILGSQNTINWVIKRNDVHGIKNILLKDQKVSLIFKPNNIIEISAKKPFKLNIRRDNINYQPDIKSGINIYNLTK